MTLESTELIDISLKLGSNLAPPQWDPSSVQIEAWRDNLGHECAFAQVAGGYPWMWIPGYGNFRLDPGGGSTVVPDKDVSRADLVDIYYRSVLPMALQLCGFEALHASAALLPQGVVALCAKSETGKSTLAYGLRERGHSLFADDTLVFNIENYKPALFQVPFAIRLRKQSATYFVAPERGETKVRGTAKRLEPCNLPLAAIFVLERLTPGNNELPALPDNGRLSGQVVEVSELSPADAFAEVLPHAYCFSLHQPKRKGLMMKQYMALVAAVPVFKARFRTGLANLPRILDELEKTVAAVDREKAA